MEEPTGTPPAPPEEPAAPRELIAWAEGPGTAGEETGLQVAQASAVATAQREVEAMVMLARRFPRSEAQAYQSIIQACLRPSFAERGNYEFERGKKKDEVSGKWVPNLVKGVSVYLAREMAKFWGNLRYGYRIISDTLDDREIEGWAWDMETNVYVSAPSRFQKLQQRKVWEDTPQGRQQVTKWVRPDERDLRELTSKQAAIQIRNCILQLLPADVVEDASLRCQDTKLAKAKQDPKGEMKKVLNSFASLNVSVEDLDLLLGHSIEQASPAEIVSLRDIFATIRDGQGTFAEYAERRRLMEEEGRSRASIKLDELKVREPGKPEGGSPPEGAGAPPPAGEQQAPPPAEAPVAGETGKKGSTKLSPAEILVHLEKMAEEKKIPPKALEEYLMLGWGIPELKQLPAEHYRAAAAWMKEWKPGAQQRERQPGED